MSVFLKGKHVEQLPQGALEAMKQTALNRLLQELRASAHDINMMVKAGELTPEQADEERKELKRQFDREREAITKYRF